MKQRRNVLAATLVAGALCVAAAGAHAQSKIKVGLMLPYTGTYAALGTAIENGFRLYVQSRAARSAAAKSSTSRSTTNRNRPRPSTT